MNVSWFLLDESELLSFDHQSVTESAILGASPRQRFFLAETRKWQLVTLLMPNTQNLCSQNSFGC